MDKLIGLVFIVAAVFIFLMAYNGAAAWGWVLGPITLIVGLAFLAPRSWQ